MFSQKLQVLTICTISIPGSFRNGSVLHMQRQRSFRVRIRRSATGTCSSREHLFRVIPIFARAPRRGSNCLSTSTISSKKPHLTYTFLTSFTCARMVSAFAFFSQPTVPNLSARLIVTRNDILLTFITSMHSTTFQYCIMIVAGMGTKPPEHTWSDAFLTVFPFSEPGSGPNMSSAFMISCRVTSQLRMCPLLASSKYRLVLGLPIRLCIVQTFSAR
jgi:hypothetical protein